MSPDDGAAAGILVPEYAATKLIAYLGNKRALLPFLLSVFLELDEESGVGRFLDPFAGSGSVSRLARSLGWAVMANDSEEYSRAVNEAWLGVSSEELPSLFAEEGGVERVFEGLNELHPEREDRELDPPAPRYISAHYAPASTELADWRRERLFYTAENATFLDRVRQAIEVMRPKDEPVGASRGRNAERALLLGSLIYEAATHANTSGVFKAYHKGFGGHGRDALGRILSPMRLEPPRLWAGPPSEVRRGEAAAFCAARSADLCYLDPPYNQHQYGSNYHLLNTIARWDLAPVDESRAPDGSLLRAAGIPPAWTGSRSAFCSRPSAARAFRELLASVDARFVLLSYNTEGLVPAGELVDMLSDRAEVSLRSTDYVKYRGGRQSSSRLSRNREILFIARRREGRGKAGLPRAAATIAETAGRSSASEDLDELCVDARLARILAGAFDPERFRELCGEGDGARSARDRETLVFREARGSISLRSYRCLVLEEGASELAAELSIGAKESLAGLLESALLPDNAAACAAAISLIEGGLRERRLQDLALHWLRKLAHRRYASDFRALAARIRAELERSAEGLGRIERGLAEIESLFEARLAGSRRNVG